MRMLAQLEIRATMSFRRLGRSRSQDGLTIPMLLNAKGEYIMTDPATSPVSSGDTAEASTRVPYGAPSSKKTKPIPNLEPFKIEPIILARLNKLDLRPASVGIATAFIVLLATSCSTLIDKAFFRPLSKTSTISDLWLFFTQSKSGTESIRSMPYLRDYPALFLTVTIMLAVPFVYGILRSMSVLHAELEKNECIGYVGNGREQIISVINKLNDRLRNYGNWAPVIVFVILVSVTSMNFGLKRQLYPFLGIDNLYDTWWTQAFPIHLGGLVWILVGSLGIYMIYVAVILGITYIKFLRNCRGNYFFKANRLNPDGFYGWSRMRECLSYQEVGAASSMISSFAMFFILQSIIGTFFAAVIIGTFMAAVFYAFLFVIHSLRRQVGNDRKRQIEEVLKGLPAGGHSNSISGHVAILVTYRHLEAIGRIPPMPIRQKFLLSGIVPMIAAVVGFINQLIKYLPR